MLFEKHNLSTSLVDILQFDIVLETDKARGNIFQTKETGIKHNLSVDVDPGYESMEKFIEGVQWCMMESKDFISNISFQLKIETQTYNLPMANQTFHIIQ